MSLPSFLLFFLARSSSSMSFWMTMLPSPVRSTRALFSSYCMILGMDVKPQDGKERMSRRVTMVVLVGMVLLE